MRVTNSMLVNNLLNNLNVNLSKMEKLNNQLASGRKFGHISDDPIALIYAQAARNRLHRLSHYQSTVESAQDWIRQVETGVMELQGRVADVYTAIIDAATDVKGLGSSSDKINVAMLIEQLRDHYRDTLNATFGDKYMYAGYNTPGDSVTGKITGPFTLNDNWELFYNGQNISNFLEISVTDSSAATTVINTNDAKGIFGGLKIDISGDPADIPGKVANAIQQVNDLLIGVPANPGPPPTDAVLGLDEINGLIHAKYEEIGGCEMQITSLQSRIDQTESEINDKPDIFYKFESDGTPTLDKLTALKEQLESDLLAERSKLSTAKNEMSALKTDQNTVLQKIQKYVNTDKLEYDVDGRVSISVGGVSLLSVADTNIPTTGIAGPNVSLIDAIDTTLNPTYDPTITDPSDPNSQKYIDPKMNNMIVMVEMVNKLKADVLTFDVGPSVSMPVTINGIDLVLFQASDGTTLNIFQVLHEAFKVANVGDEAGEVGSYIKELQDGQNHLLTKVAELGGRTRRLDLLTARYEQDNINYEQMKSDAEDADFAEVIMYQKMAEAVYQAALSAGARTIQPTLMDFLR